MAKKIWYSSPLKFFWNDLYGTQKKITPNISDKQIFNLLRYNLINAPLPDGENAESRELLLTGWELWKEDSEGDFLHIFFLDKQLRDFLVKTPLSDLDSIRKYLYDNGINKTVVYFKTKSLSNCVIYTFGLHIPYETNGYALSLSLYEDNSIELYFSHGTQHGRLSDKFYSDLNRKQDEKSLILANIFRLAINTIAYMKCFPECVTDGVPRITKERNEKRSERNVTIQLSEKITESENTHHSKIPHFRKGYFKMLRSDFYTHKQGEIIFVSETMVKGKAKTVSTSIRIDEF
ncbi:MAG TPA: hypothetical protein P5295_09885 [Spirochaetota bacterium]|nr:hypothetical protein [Spirochaetota bacterium]